MKQFIVGALVSIALAASMPASACFGAEPAEPAGRQWLALGFGLGAGPDKPSNEFFDHGAFLVSGNVLRGSHVWSLRYSRLGLNPAVGDLAILYGRVLARGHVFASVDAGAGLLHEGHATYSISDCCGDDRAVESLNFDRAGIAWAAQLSTDSAANANIGLHVFGSFAGATEFWGWTVALLIPMR